MASKIQRELAFLLTGRDVSASKAMTNLNRRISGLERHSGKAFSNISKNMERGLVIGAGAAVGAIGYAVKQAMDWESAFAGVRKTVEGTPEQIAAIEQGIRDLSKVMPTSAVELAAIAENAGALGIARKDILSFTKVVAMIGATTNVSSEDAATALGQLQNVLGLTGADFDNFAAALVDLGNKGASTEAQILEIARRSGGAAKLVGIAKDATLGWAAAAANLGMQDEIAGTSLQRFFQIVQTNVGSGGKKLETLAKTAGMTADGFKKAFGKDASGTLAKFVKGLNKIPKEERLAVVQKVFGKGTGLTRLIIGLADSFDRNLNPALHDSKSAWADGTAAQAEYEKRVQTTAAQLDIFKNNVNDAAITVGSALLPQLVELSKEGTAWLTEHQDEIKTFGEDLADNIRDAVTWAKQLDWNAIGKALEAGAGAAKALVDAFAGMPPELQQLLVGGFVVNKATGGVLTDIAGGAGSALFKGLVLKSLGIQAGIVNVNGPVAGGAGSGSGGVSGSVGGVLKGAAAVTGGVAVAGIANEVGLALGQALFGSNQQAMDNFTVANSNAMQAAFGPFESLRRLPDLLDNLGRIPEEVGAAVRGAKGQLNGTQSNVGHITHAASAGTIANDPTGFKNSGAGSAILKTLGDTHSEQLATTAAVKGVEGKQGESLIAFRAAERTSASGLATAASASRLAGATSALATYGGASRIVGAIASNRPITNTSVVVNISAANVSSSVSVSERTGRNNGSAGGGSQTRRPG